MCFYSRFARSVNVRRRSEHVHAAKHAQWINCSTAIHAKHLNLKIVFIDLDVKQVSEYLFKDVINAYNRIYHNLCLKRQ